MFLSLTYITHNIQLKIHIDIFNLKLKLVIINNYIAINYIAG